jgi:hypothetical protein
LLLIVDIRQKSGDQSVLGGQTDDVPRDIAFLLLPQFSLIGLL